MTAPSRPILRYHGGKWKLAPWIISHFPPHRVYIEPFGGAGSVLLRKPRCHAEVYNDQWGEVVNVFRVLRDPESAEALRRAIELTPFSREEFMACEPGHEDPVERARRSILRSHAGFGSASVNGSHRTGFRGTSKRAGTTPAHDWANWPQHIPTFVDRLRGVTIENRDAVVVIKKNVEPDALVYADPPYLHDTRNMERGNAAYACEMDEEGHRRLADCLRSLDCMVVVSGYAHPVYDEDLYAGWRRRECRTFADGARERREILWMNPKCAEASRGLLPFAEAAS